MLRRISTALASAGLLLAAPQLLAAEAKPTPPPAVAKIELQAAKLADSIYLVQGSGDGEALAGNSDRPFNGELFSGANTGAYVGKDGVLLVDPKYPQLEQKLIALLTQLGAAQPAPRYIVNTHIHKDHLDGNRAFAQRTTIISHAGLRNGLAAGRAEFVLPQEAWPTLTYEHSITLHLDGREIRIVNYPGGHTDGDSVVYFVGTPVVQMGDLFFNGYLPKVDLKNGGNFFRYRAIVKQIHAQLPENAQIIPGHGPLATKQDLATYIRLLDDTGDLVQEKIKQGKSLAQIQKEGIPAQWRSWRWGLNTPEHFLELVYDSAKQL